MSNGSKEKAGKSEVGSLQKDSKDCAQDVAEKRKGFEEAEATQLDIIKTHRAAHEKSMKDLVEAHEKSMVASQKELANKKATIKANKAHTTSCAKGAAIAKAEQNVKKARVNGNVASVSKLTSVLKENQIKSKNYMDKVVKKSMGIEARVNDLNKRMSAATKDLKALMPIMHKLA